MAAAALELAAHWCTTSVPVIEDAHKVYPIAAVIGRAAESGQSRDSSLKLSLTLHLWAHLSGRNNKAPTGHECLQACRRLSFTRVLTHWPVSVIVNCCCCPRPSPFGQWLTRNYLWPLYLPPICLYNCHSRWQQMTTTDDHVHSFVSSYLLAPVLATTSSVLVPS